MIYFHTGANYVAIKWPNALISTCFTKAFCFCVLRLNEAFISCTRWPPFGSAMLSYTQCSPVSSVSTSSSQRTGSLTLYCNNQPSGLPSLLNYHQLLFITIVIWVLLNHSHKAHYIRQMPNFFLGHNIHVPIHGLCNQLFLYFQSNQAECCHLVMLFSASTQLWKASSCLFICLSVRPSVCPHTTT